MQTSDPSSERGSIASRWMLPALAAILAVVSAYGVVGLARERHHAQDLAATNQSLSASLRQVQTELQAVSAKLTAMAAQPAQISSAAGSKPPVRPVTRPKVRLTVQRATATSRAPEPRWQQMQARLEDQQKEIASTRQELQDRLNSTRDELSSSIARNHEELVSLQKRGERNYYEFDLDKSKQFHRIGPLNLSLRKVSTKHKNYDLAMTVDDQQLEKKQVSLYEPLMLTIADRPQPIELVVNEIRNNEIKGYVSEPKYGKSELASTAPAPAETKELQRR